MSTTNEMLITRIEVLEKQLALLLKTDEKVPDLKPKKSKKSPKVETDEPKKKRTSGYILFSNANREQVNDALSDGDEKPKNTDIMKELAKRWKDLDDKDKEHWNTKAKELKEAD